jgi:hypothetical protein
MSFFGLQGRLVYTSDYLETLIDLNKGTTGYESCVVGENHLSQLDAYKAVAILKNKLRKKEKNDTSSVYYHQTELTRNYFLLQKVVFGEETKIEGETLWVKKQSPSIGAFSEWIENVEISLIPPTARERRIHSNLDFSPIACKKTGVLGEGVTHILQGVTVMVTGVEQGSRFEPANIGSSEGRLTEQVFFDTPGTPEEKDTLLHFDFLFKEGHGRTKEGIRAAHEITDQVVEQIRQELRELDVEPVMTETFRQKDDTPSKKVVVVKSVSGLGNMYETAMFPNQPAGYVGTYSTMDFMNMPVVVSGNQVLDGVIHSLL